LFKQNNNIIYIKNKENFIENLVAPATKWPATKLAVTKLQRRKVVDAFFAVF